MPYNFKPNGSLRIQYKTIDPDNDDVKQAVTLFYISIGSLANIVQTQVKDTHDYVKTLNDYYKRDVKYHIKEANARIDKMMDVFKKYTEEANGFKMWLDITDEMEDKLRCDIQKAYYSLDNYISRNSTGGDHKLLAHSVLTFNLATMLVIMTRDYATAMFEGNPNIPSGFRVSSEYTNLASGVSRSLASLCKALVPGEEFVYDKAQLFSCYDLKVALDIIFNSLILNRDNIQDSCEQALSSGGVNFSKIDEIDKKDNDFRNKGTEWNETQIGVITAYFKDTPDGTLAVMLGRSVYEVRKKAKELGLKKSERYLKKIRTNNLKKKGA